MLLMREWYMHPNGQLPAYEWAFGDVNPPVHAWAAWRVYEIDRDADRRAPTPRFLERVFHKLLLNFTWWVNRKDADGRNIFQGGFLGLDNIGVFDRSTPLPDRRHASTRPTAPPGWRCITLNLLRIALELALARPGLRGHRHQVLRAFPLHRRGDDRPRRRGHRPVGRGGRVLLRRAAPARRPREKMRVRSMVGLIPLFAVEVLDASAATTAARVRRAAALVPALPAGPREADLALGRAGHGRARPAVAAARTPHEEAAGAHAGRAGVPLAVRRALAVARASGRAVLVAARRAGLQHRL